MSSDKIHSVDAHVPSDSEEFEQKVQQKQLPLTPRMQEALRRVQNYAMFYAQNEKIGMGMVTMILEMYCQMAVMHATILAHDELIKRESGTTKEQMLDRIAEFIEERLMIAQIEYKILITPEKVVPVEADGQDTEH